MKHLRDNIKILIVSQLLCFSIILGGCGTSQNSNETPLAKPTNAISPVVNDIPTTLTPTSIPTVIPSGMPTITPAVSATIKPTVSTDKTVVDKMKKYVDGNGVNDLIKIISRNDGAQTKMEIHFNGKKIFEYEDPNSRMMGIDAFESFDLDGDNKNEILIAASTDANCRPYEELLCLKQTGDKWRRMNYPKNQQGNYEFPFKITRGKNEFDFIISSKMTKQVVHYNASRYYIDSDSGNDDSIKEYRRKHYKEGDEVGFLSGWGIYEAKVGTFKGQKCIVAIQGIEGPYGHSLGMINIYFKYNIQGNVDILNVKYIPD